MSASNNKKILVLYKHQKFYFTVHPCFGHQLIVSPSASGEVNTDLSYSHARAYAHTHALLVVPAPVTLQLSPRHQSQTETKSTEVFFVQFYGRDVLRDFLVGNKKKKRIIANFKIGFVCSWPNRTWLKRGDSNWGVIWRTLLCSFWLALSWRESFYFHLESGKLFSRLSQAEKL